VQRDETLLLLGLGLLWFYNGGNFQKKSTMNWTDEEMFIFNNCVKRTGVPTEAALAVYTGESGLNPKASSGAAFGIAQITAATLRDIGWSSPAKDFLQLGVADQAPWIEKLLNYQAKAVGFTPTNALDLYVTNLSPAAAKAHRDVIYSASVPSEVAAYEGNKGLDKAKKGYIDRADLALYLDRILYGETYKQAVDQLNRIRGLTR